MKGEEALVSALRQRIEILRDISRMTSEAMSLGDLDVGTFQRLTRLRQRVLASWPAIPEGLPSERVEALREEARELVTAIQALDARVLEDARRLRTSIRDRLGRCRPAERAPTFHGVA